MNDLVKIWTCKYALSGGVVTPEMATIKENYAYVGTRYSQFVIGRDAFLTIEEAQAGAEAMRLKKITSLEKQITKLKAMTFADKDAPQ